MPQLAVINESACIGCTLCQQACPTAAIVGAAKHKHTIIADLCTGCGACLPPCPPQCITWQAAPPKHLFSSASPAAQQAVAQRTAFVAARRAQPSARQTLASNAAPPVALPPLPAHLLAKVAAAQQKSAQKFAAKGPLRTPRALRPKKGS